jgi:hypothetical protein
MVTSRKREIKMVTCRHGEPTSEERGDGEVENGVRVWRKRGWGVAATGYNSLCIWPLMGQASNCRGRQWGPAGLPHVSDGLY